MFMCEFRHAARRFLVVLILLCPNALSAQKSSPDDAWLTHVRSLYTSTARDGLKGFDCAVRPDWRTLMASANNGTVDAEGERKIAVLSTVRVTMHARMDGKSSIDWKQDNSPAEMADMLKQMEGGTRQTLEGFLQFWTPFADLSMIPASSTGLEISKTADGGHLLHAVDKDATVTETLDASDVLREYDVKMTGQTILFTPTFTSTPAGLRVTHFLTHIRPANSSEDQELQVGVAYTSFDGFTIPTRLDMTVVGTGIFNFTMEGCKVNP
jgi:hypothetical protein